MIKMPPPPHVAVCPTPEETYWWRELPWKHQNNIWDNTYLHKTFFPQSILNTNFLFHLALLVISSVGFSFIFSWVLMGFVVTTFVVGGNIEKLVCEPLANRQIFKVLSHYNFFILSVFKYYVLTFALNIYCVRAFLVKPTTLMSSTHSTVAPVRIPACGSFRSCTPPQHPPPSHFLSTLHFTLSKIKRLK